MIEARFSIRRGDFALLFDETLPAQGVTAIVGKSGAGKTTLLRWMAGLERLAEGDFVVNGKVYQQGRYFVPPERRSVGYVGQDSRLLPFLTGEKNLAFAQKRRLTTYDAPNLGELIEVFAVSPCLKSLPAHLSTGETQRLSVIQSLLSCPELFLFDEAFGTIDTARKRVILDYLMAYFKRLALPVVYVSHDDGEIAPYVDKVIKL